MSALLVIGGVIVLIGAAAWGYHEKYNHVAAGFPVLLGLLGAAMAAIGLVGS